MVYLSTRQNTVWEKKIQSGAAIVFLMLTLISGMQKTRATADQKTLGTHYFLPYLESEMVVSSRRPGWRWGDGVLFNPKNPAIAYIGSWEREFQEPGRRRYLVCSQYWPGYLQIQSLAIDPLNPETIYAGTYHYGVYNDHGGASWFASGQGLK